MTFRIETVATFVRKGYRLEEPELREAVADYIIKQGCAVDRYRDHFEWCEDDDGRTYVEVRHDAPTTEEGK
jgi:hypothetical protein